MSELNVEVDKNDEILGLRSRKDFQTGKYIHRGSHLILLNSNNEILLQKRSKDKFWDPDVWDFSAGGTVSDESYELCMIRESEEEIGIKLTTMKDLFTYYYSGEFDKAFHRIFLAKSDEKIVYQESEIQYVKWISIDNLRKDLKLNPNDYSPVARIGFTRFLELNLF